MLHGFATQVPSAEVPGPKYSSPFATGLLAPNLSWTVAFLTLIYTSTAIARTTIAEMIAVSEGCEEINLLTFVKIFSEVDEAVFCEQPVTKRERINITMVNRIVRRLNIEARAGNNVPLTGGAWASGKRALAKSVNAALT